MTISPQPEILLVADLPCGGETKGAESKHQSGRLRLPRRRNPLQSSCTIYVCTRFCCSEICRTLMTLHESTIYMMPVHLHPAYKPMRMCRGASALLHDLSWPVQCKAHAPSAYATLQPLLQLQQYYWPAC